MYDQITSMLFQNLIAAINDKISNGEEMSISETALALIALNSEFSLEQLNGVTNKLYEN